MERKTFELEFISWMRGIGCLVVMFSHHVMIFLYSGVDSIWSWVLPKKFPPPKIISGLVATFDTYHISFGAVGVAVFFIITGFVTTMSLDRSNRGIFLIKRLIRIWPTYIVGTAILYLCSIFYTMWAGTELTSTVKEFAIQASLIRDVLWVPSVDGLGWTLEVQVKMYLIYFLFHRLHLLDSWKRVLEISFICFLLVLLLQPNLEAALAFHLRVYVALYLICFTAVYIVLGSIGIAIYQYYAGKWERRECVVVILLCVMLDSVMITTFMKNPTIRDSYIVAIVLFLSVFAMRDQIQCGKIMGFISKISFSMYIIHAVNGYYLLSVLDHYGVNPYMSVLITFAASVVIAYLLWRFVEKPTGLLAKKIGS